MPFSLNEDNLYEIFGKFGTVERVKIPQGEDGRPRGFGFVDFTTAGNSFFDQFSKNVFQLLKLSNLCPNTTNLINYSDLWTIIVFRSQNTVFYGFNPTFFNIP